MDNLGSEVGQKMRCAVKAKLVELGTGGSAGYIDDELPDYVMIMVANKRSKQQMIEDLNLFLGSNTEVFVIWLHQVLEKLHEVTLPTAMLQKNKRKISDSNEIPNKKEKKDKKKDKKLKKSREKTPEELIINANKSKGVENETTPSITDVFANQLIQKAKSDFEDDLVTKTELKSEETNNKNKTANKSDDFDIPTISEIAETTNDQTVGKRKELQELEELQNRINLAKKQLRAMGSEESDDEDFLNIKDDEADDDSSLHNDDLNEEEGETKPVQKEIHVRNRSPIVFNRNNLKKVNDQSDTRKASVLNRLGNRSKTTNKETISLSAHRRAEKELYVPSFRKRETDKQVTQRISSPLDHKVERSKSERNYKSLGYKSNNEDSTHSGKNNISCSSNSETRKGILGSQRIGSRIIVAPPKVEANEEEEQIDVPVNSVVKIKPRPVIPAHKQASKNLLLRAVAEAQRSTSLSQHKKQSTSKNKDSNNVKTSSKSEKKTANQKTIKSNIIIEIPQILKNVEKDNAYENDDSESEEYIPEPVTSQSNENDSSSNDERVYIPRSINLKHRIDIRENSKSNDSRTQFVVTLDGMYDNSSTSPVRSQKLGQQLISSEKNSSKEHRIEVTTKTRLHTIEKEENVNTKLLTPQAVVTVKAEPLDVIKEIIKKNTSINSNTNPKSNIVEKKQIVNNNINNTIIKNNSNVIKNKNISKPKPVKRLIIKTNDTTDDEKDFDKSISPPKVKQLKMSKRSKVSPIKFDLALSKKDGNDKKVDEFNENKNVENTNKYDNIPPLLSAVTVPIDNKPRQKEKCKYYPGCRQGDSCEFFHPSSACKSFPNCKFGDKCLYIHPNCKFDITCTRPDCNFNHTRMSHSAPPLASHVVPVQNYKTISANPLPAMCKFYPNCTNNVCPFYHPKLCRFGKTCLNKVECNYYHHELPTVDKLKWVSPANI